MTSKHSSLHDNMGNCERCDQPKTVQRAVPVLLGGGIGWGTMWMCDECIIATGRKPPSYRPPER